MKILAGIILAVLSALPAPGQENADAEASIRSARERLSAAERRGDGAAILESYAEDVVLLPPGEQPVTGRPAAGRWLEAAARAGDSRPHTRFEALSLEVYGAAASEIGDEISGGASAGSTVRVRHLTIWRKQPDGSWKIARDAWDRPQTSGQAAAAPAPAQPRPAPSPAPAAAAPAPPKPAPPAIPVPVAIPAPAPRNTEQFIPIPDPGALSEGYVRQIGDRLRSRCKKIRLLEAAPPAPERDARLASTEQEAAHYLETTIRDIGWIDIRRFTVPISCDAAFIVEKSGDRRLFESTLAIMDRDLKNSEGGPCFAAALQAYSRLPPKS